MPAFYITRAALAETVRDPRKNDRLGQGAINHSSNPAERATQSPSKFRFARAIARIEGPRLAKPGWCNIAARLARERHDESALTAAMRRALVEMGARP